MARPRRKIPQLVIAQRYIEQHKPELKGTLLRIRQLDGPPDSPRFAVTAEQCGTAVCPHGVPRDVADAGQCYVAECPLRHTTRMLLNRDGTVVQVTEDDRHWS